MEYLGKRLRVVASRDFTRRNKVDCQLLAVGATPDGELVSIFIYGAFMSGASEAGGECKTNFRPCDHACVTINSRTVFEGKIMCVLNMAVQFCGGPL